MKFSSEDVAHQEFETRFRGYDVEQVREFLSVLARELDDLVTEGKRLQRDLDVAHREIAEYRKRERSLQDALQMARDAASDMLQKAERDAELKLAEAEIEAERILARAQRAADSLAEDTRRLKEQRRRIAAEMRATLEMHLHLLESQKKPEWLESGEIDRTV